jgi:hypothetical protein
MRRPLHRGLPWVLAAAAVAIAVMPAKLGAAPGSSASASAPAAAPPSSVPASSAAASKPVMNDPMPLAMADIPSEKSAMPKRDEWKDARPVVLTRVGAGNDACSANLLREYLRVTCAMPLSIVRQYAGNVDDVSTWLIPKPEDQAFLPPVGGEVVFPLRRGESYAFGLFELATGGYEGGGVFPGASHILDAYWLDGEAAPTVVLR